MSKLLVYRRYENEMTCVNCAGSTTPFVEWWLDLKTGERTINGGYTKCGCNAYPRQNPHLEYHDSAELKAIRDRAEHGWQGFDETVQEGVKP